MPKTARELGSLAVSRLTKTGWNAVGGVTGLGLQITETGSRAWVLRITVGNKRRAIGLGSYPTVLLAEARDRARQARAQIRDGVDPVVERKKAKDAIAASQAKAVTFEMLAAQYIKSREASWSNAKHAAQWAATLATYAYPVIGHRLVSEINENDVLRVLEAPIGPEGETFWNSKTETASRVRQRIEAVLDYGAVKKLRDGENPARWKGKLSAALPDRAKVQKVQHHAAMKFGDVPSFMTRLRSVQGQGARALEFAILTAARSGEVRGMKWPEVDLDQCLWTIPASRMKAGREHRVPLSEAAVQVLQSQTKIDGCDLVFPSTKKTALSDMTLTAVLRRMGLEYTAHGFRSSFRDWTAEMTTYPNHVAEQALAHTIGDKVEAAYRRGDLLKQRRRLMDDWAAYLGHPTTSNPSL